MSYSKQIFVIGYYGAGNLGDELLLQSICKIIQDYSPLYFCKHLSNNKYNNSNNSVYKFNILKIISTIYSSDYLIYGGGSIFQDSTSVLSLVYYCMLALLGKLFNKKILLVAQGIGPFHHTYTELLTCFVYKSANLITIREGEYNRQYLDKWQFSKYTQTADLVWNYLNAQLPIKPQESKANIILISLRFTKDQFDIPECINDILSSHNNIQNVNYKFWALSPDDIRLYNQYNLQDFNIDLVKDYQDINWHQVQHIYAMRLHAVIISTIYNISVTCIPYDPKVLSLQKLLTNNNTQELRQSLINKSQENTKLIHHFLSKSESE